MRISHLPVALTALLVFTACGPGGRGTPNSHGVATTGAAVTGGICPAGPTVSGIDVSAWQGSVDWGAVHGAGIQFALARIGDGTYQDSYFSQNWSGMKAAGLLRGSYQFFEPAEDPTTQANLVINNVGKLGPGDLPVMLDVEVTGGLSPSAIVSRIHTWMDAVAAGTGKMPYIYTGAYFWDDNVGSSDFSNLALNVAWYGTNCPGVPNAWSGSGWTFHQFTDSFGVAGVSGNVDADVFNGSLQQLQRFAGGDLLEGAFQANTGSLWTTGSAGTQNWNLGMKAGTSPSISALVGGGYVVAFQANTGSLWTAGTPGIANLNLGMMNGTSPSVAALDTGGYVIAFQANTGSLWTAGTAGTRDWGLGMKAGTSPSITALPGGGYQIAFQANTGSLWTTGTAGTQSWNLGMMNGTSPSIASLVGGGYVVAFQANTGGLWTAGTPGVANLNLGMMHGTSPSVTGLLSGGYEIAFQANTSSLWTTGSAGTRNWGLGMAAGSSPAIERLGGSDYKVLFQANTTSLWQAATTGEIGALNLGMWAATSPSGT